MTTFNVVDVTNAERKVTIEGKESTVPCMVIVTKEGRTFMPSLKQWNRATGKHNCGDTDFIGGELNVEFFKKGDKLINGTIVDKDEVLARNYALIPMKELRVVAKAAECKYQGALSF